MAAPDFFARFVPEFALQLGSARDNVDRQADADRLLSKAEYELYQVRRELVGLIDGAEEPPELAEANRPYSPLAAKAA